MKRAIGGVLAAAAVVVVLTFSTSSSQMTKVQNTIMSTAEAFDCMWAYHYGPWISGGGTAGVGITASSNSGYAPYEFLLWQNGCGGSSGPAIAVDVDLWGHGGASNWGRQSAHAFYGQGGEHYGLHQGSSAHFVMWYLVQQQQTSVDFGWPPAPPGSCGEYWQYDEGSGQCLSPIIIHLKKGEVKELTSAANGVLFDIDADGVIDQMSWTKRNKKNQALLVMDRNNNGTIDNGAELFGNFTVEGAVNGFDALNRLVNSNEDGVADSRDPLFAQLQLWTDLNHDGISQSSELQPASNYLENIGLGADLDNKVDKNGNRFLYRGWATFKGEGKRADRELDIFDIYLVKQ